MFTYDLLRYYFIKSKLSKIYSHKRETVQDAKPRTCRLYPFWVEPAAPDGKGLKYHYSTEHPHHPRGSLVRVKDWIRANLTNEDRAFLAEEWRAVKEIAPLMHEADVAGVDSEKILKAILYHRYLGFDCSQPFLRQQLRNDIALREEMRSLIRGKRV